MMTRRTGLQAVVFAVLIVGCAAPPPPPPPPAYPPPNAAQVTAAIRDSYAAETSVKQIVNAPGATQEQRRAAQAVSNTMANEADARVKRAAKYFKQASAVDCVWGEISAFDVPDFQLQRLGEIPAMGYRCNLLWEYRPDKDARPIPSSELTNSAVLFVPANKTRFTFAGYYKYPY